MELPNPAMEFPGSTGRVSSRGHRVTEFRTLPLSWVAPSLLFQYVAVSCGFNGVIGFLDCLESLVWEGSMVWGERDTRRVSATTRTMFFLQKASR